MCRYRLRPTPTQEVILKDHCAQARFVWNLAAEQQSWWRPGRRSVPGYLQQCRQLTAARSEHEWLRNGSQMVQQQALRDLAQAMQHFFAGTHRRPGGRKAGRSEGFRIVAVRPGHVRRLDRGAGEIWLPKAGWVRFGWSRPVPAGVKSCRVTLDRAGRWHIAFAVIPGAIPGPGTGEVVGLDRGIAVSTALSTGELLKIPRPSPGRQRRLQLLQLLQRKLAESQRGSRRHGRVKLAVAKLKAHEVDARRDWCEKLSTDLAWRFDLIRIENLNVSNMTHSVKGTLREPGKGVARKASLNREILASGWGLLERRLEEKAPGRIERVNPAFTSQRCSACRSVDRRSRESQAVFRCRSCGFACNADLNAARNIAAGHAVTARRGVRAAGPVNREPQQADLRVDSWNPRRQAREDVKRKNTLPRGGR
jgi:putative transposase